MADFSDLSDANDGEFARTLTREAGVAPVPGSSFLNTAAGNSSLVRFAFCKQIPTLEQASERLRSFARAGSLNRVASKLRTGVAGLVGSATEVDSRRPLRHGMPAARHPPQVFGVASGGTAAADSAVTGEAALMPSAGASGLPVKGRPSSVSSSSAIRCSQRSII